MINHLPSVTTLLTTCDFTWPSAAQKTVGAWTIRDGKGGGKRVSAATQNWPTTEADLPSAEQAMRDMDMVPLFQIREGEQHLDDMLAQHGYDIIDPVNFWVSHVAPLTETPLPPVSGFDIWPPLAIMTELWEEGDIGAARRAVMERANCVKTGILARIEDKPAGVAFVGIHDDIAMIHAIYVTPALRRKGAGRIILKHAAAWAKTQNAQFISLIVTQGNHAANPLYADLGMDLVGHYHYRIKSDEGHTQ